MSAEAPPPPPVPMPAGISPAERLLRVHWLSTLRRTESGTPELGPEVIVELGRRVHVIDIRYEEELTGPLGHIPGAVWVPLAEIAAVAERLPPEAPVVIVSRTGSRSAGAARALEAAGMTWVASMRGGMVAWKNFGFATTRDASFRERTAATLSDAGRAPEQPAPVDDGEPPPILKLEQIRDHVGDPRSVQWVKMAAFLLHGKISCVDGRDDHGVVGTPGGDAGELLLAVAATEALTGRTIARPAFAALLSAYLDTFGHFYVHTDTAAGNRFIASMRADPVLGPELPPPSMEAFQWRRYLMEPPEHLRPLMLEHVGLPEHIGCGHLRLMSQHGEEYGVRPELVRWFFQEYFTIRWNGAVEAEFVVLGGGHREGAVVNVRLGDEIWPFTRVPLVSPACGETQMFVNHPEVAAFLRRQIAAFMTTRPETGLHRGDLDPLLDQMTAMAGRQLASTLGRLAQGLPVFDIRFEGEQCFGVAPA